MRDSFPIVVRVLFNICLLLSTTCAANVTPDNSKFLGICETSLKTADYSKALEECKFQLTQSQQKESDFDTVFLYLYLVDIYHALGDTASEDLFLKKVANHPLFSKDPRIGYLWNRKKGQKYYLLKDYQQSKIFLYQGLAVAIENDNDLWVSKSYNDVGLIESQLGNFKQSLIHYKKSLALKLEQGDLYIIGTTLNNIGLVYTKIENYSESISYYEKSLKSFLDYTNQKEFDQRVFVNIAHLYEDLSVTYSKINAPKKEAYYQRLMIDSIDNKQSAYQRTRTLVNIAKLQLAHSQFQSAQSLLEKASLLQTQFKFNLKLEIDFHLAQLFLQTGELDRAIALSNGVLFLAKEQNNLSQQADIYLLLAQAYKQSDQKTAYHYLELFNQARESYLEQKFNFELKTVQFQIEKQQIEHDLVLQQVENSKNQAKIQRLTSWSLSFVILFLISVGFFIFYLFKKKKEKQQLLIEINNHKQQLLLINDKQKELENTSNADYKSSTIKQKLREILVKTMLDAVNVWESHSGKNKVELAEKSKLWTISIDEGTLRTRSLDKYLSIDKIPQNPKWRNVAGTCHFILADPSLSTENRSLLKERLESLMIIVKNLSMSRNSH